jgi:hypothetical protein
LSLKIGDIIEQTGISDESDWSEGKIRETIGLYPTKFAEKIKCEREKRQLVIVGVNFHIF